MKDKWRAAIGTTSRVPHSPVRHYLILDFDGEISPTESIFLSLLENLEKAIIQKTPHGFHVYTSLIGTFEWALEAARVLGADPEWLRIAKSRGYLFLADKDHVEIPWPVERMAIRWQRKQKQARS